MPFTKQQLKDARKLARKVYQAQCKAQAIYKKKYAALQIKIEKFRQVTNQMHTDLLREEEVRINTSYFAIPMKDLAFADLVHDEIAKLKLADGKISTDTDDAD